jgi:hypothetical protein
MPQRSELHGATQPESYSRQDENVPRFFLASALDSSTTALNLVYQRPKSFAASKIAPERLKPEPSRYAEALLKD